MGEVVVNGLNRLRGENLTSKTKHLAKKVYDDVELEALLNEDLLQMQKKTSTRCDSIKKFILLKNQKFKTRHKQKYFLRSTIIKEEEIVEITSPSFIIDCQDEYS